MPLWIHDPDGGRLAIRSSWDDNAQWLGTMGGGLRDAEGKLFAPAPGSATPFGPHLLISGVPKTAVGAGDAAADVVIFTGLEPGGQYQVQSGLDKPSEVVADRNGFVSATHAAGSTAGIRLSRIKAKRR